MDILSNIKLKHWFLFIFLVGFCLRFWGLTRFNILVFDEVYYAQFANNYFTRTQFFNVHPPLSQYLIALGMWLSSWLPASPETINYLTGSWRSTWSYRWLNALIGSFIPILCGSIMFKLSQSYAAIIITAIGFTFEGLFLVMSRYALSDIYLIFFGLLGQLYLLIYLENQQDRPLLLAGICFGCCVGVKWNGLGFLLGSIAILVKLNLNRQNIWRLAIGLGIIPVITYIIIWLPHLALNPKYGGFWRVHQQIINFHNQLGGNEIHPYCSPWYSWLMMKRPIALYYQTVNDNQTIYDVHAMGNPILWWLSTAAIVWLLLELIIKAILYRIHRDRDWVSIYLVVNFGANFLPWMRVNRCLFIYHYMPAYVFAIFALAWLIARGYQTNRRQIIAFLIIMLIIAAFIFWSPLYFGLPVSIKEYYLRMWFKSWI